MVESENLQKHTLYLRRGDYQRLQEILHNSEVTAGETIRNQVSRLVDALEKSPPTEEAEQVAEGVEL